MGTTTTLPAHRLLELSSADYIAAACWDSANLDAKLDEHAGSKWSSTLLTEEEDSEGLTIKSSSLTSSVTKATKPVSTGSLAAAKIAMAPSGESGAALLRTVKKFTPLCTATLNKADLVTTVSTKLPQGEPGEGDEEAPGGGPRPSTGGGPATKSVAVQGAAGFKGALAPAGGVTGAGPGTAASSPQLAKVSGESLGKQASEPLDIPRRTPGRAPLGALKVSQERQRPPPPQRGQSPRGHDELLREPQAKPHGGPLKARDNTALGTWAQRKLLHTVPPGPPSGAKPAGHKLVSHKLRSLLGGHDTPAEHVEEEAAVAGKEGKGDAEGAEGEPRRRWVTYWAPGAHDGERPKARAAFRRPTDAARRELAALEQLTGLERAEADWKIRFKRKWMLEEIHALRKAFPADDPGYKDVWDDALQLIGACGPGVNAQVDTRAQFLAWAGDRAFTVDDGTEDPEFLEPESGLIFEPDDDLAGPSAEALVSLESFMGGADDPSQNPFWAVHHARRREGEGGAPGGPPKPQTMGAAAEALLKQQRAIEEQARKAWSQAVPQGPASPPRGVAARPAARAGPSAAKTIARPSLEWSDFVI